MGEERALGGGSQWASCWRPANAVPVLLQLYAGLVLDSDVPNAFPCAASAGYPSANESLLDVISLGSRLATVKPDANATGDLRVATDVAADTASSAANSSRILSAEGQPRGNEGAKMPRMSPWGPWMELRPSLTPKANVRVWGPALGFLPRWSTGGSAREAAGVRSTTMGAQSSDLDNGA